MEAIAFCSRCRGMKIGWNRRYLVHCIRCREWMTASSKLLILTVFLSIVIFGFPAPDELTFSGNPPQQIIQRAGLHSPVAAVIDPAVRSIEALLKGYGVDQSHRGRVAESIVSSGRKHDLDPRLIASIVIVESRANPFAISGRDAVGLMQIHLPTWGRIALRDGINLFKIEDNVDFGTRILKEYIRQSGLWGGVQRYNGWFVKEPESESTPDQDQQAEYLAKVQRIYGVQEPLASTADLLQ